MLISATEARKMLKYLQHKNCSIKYDGKHVVKLKEILGKDKQNHHKGGHLDVDTADIANGIETSLLISSLGASFQIH